MSKVAPKSLSQVWAARYFIFIIAGASTLFAVVMGLFHLDTQVKLGRALEQIAQDIAMEAAASGGALDDDHMLSFWMDERVRGFTFAVRPVVMILDAGGDIVQRFPRVSTTSSGDSLADGIAAAKADLITGEAGRVAIPASPDGPSFLAAIHPIEIDAHIRGYALFSLPEQPVYQIWTGPNAIPFRGLFVAALIVTSWWIIYFLTRRLVRPIGAAAEAAKRIVNGEYDIQLPDAYQEREIQELTASFREMAARLQHLESLRSQWVAGVTHELKNPVTSISGLIEAIQSGLVRDNEAAQCLQACQKEIERLTRIIDDLLEYGRFSTDSVSVSREAIDAFAIVQDIVERWRLSAAPGNRLHVAIEAEDGVVNRRALVDPIRFEQVLVNLLKNAREAMAGSGTITLKLKGAANSLSLEVRDEGEGIPPHEQADVFEPFFRGSQKRTQTPGLGLGLPFSRLIARSFGGDLVLSASDATGSTFTLTLPAADAVRKVG